MTGYRVGNSLPTPLGHQTKQTSTEPKPQSPALSPRSCSIGPAVKYAPPSEKPAERCQFIQLAESEGDTKNDICPAAPRRG